MRSFCAEPRNSVYGTPVVSEANRVDGQKLMGMVTC